MWTLHNRLEAEQPVPKKDITRDPFFASETMPSIIERANGEGVSARLFPIAE